MANIHIKRAHQLGLNEARARVDHIASSLQDKLEANWAWQGNRLSFNRSGASGTVDVEDNFIEFNVKLGLLLTPLKGKIESTLNEEIEKALV